MSKRNKEPADGRVIGTREAIVSCYLTNMLGRLQTGLNTCESLDRVEEQVADEPAELPEDADASEELWSMTSEELAELDQKLERHNAYCAVMRRRNESDTLHALLYNSANTVWRYSVLAHFFDVIVQWMEHSVDGNLSVSGHGSGVISEEEREAIRRILYPLNWDSCPCDSWEEFAASVEEVSWRPMLPHDTKVMEETVLIMGFITCTSAGRHWLFGERDNAPKKANPTQLRAFLESDVTPRLQDIVNGKDAYNSLSKFAAYVWGTYHMIVAGCVDPSSPYARQMDMMSPEPMHFGEPPAP